MFFMADYNITLAMGFTGAASVNNATSSNRIQVPSGQSFTVQISSGITASGSKGVGGANTAPYYGSGYFVNQGTSSGVYTRTYSALSPTLVGNDYRLRWVGYLDGSVYGSIANENYQNGVMYITVAEAEENQSHPAVTGVSIANTASSSTTATISTTGGTGTLQTAAVSYYWPPPPDSAFSNGNTQTVTRGTAYWFWARSEEYSQSNTDYGRWPAAQIGGGYTPGYLTPDTNITVVDITSSTGTWNNQVYSITGNYNTYWLYSSGYGSQLYDLGGSAINTGLGGALLSNNNPANTPEGATTTYNVGVSRSTASGGSAVIVGTSDTFTVTRAVDAVCHDTSGKWFDATSSAVDPNNTDNTLRTRATFSSMSTSRRYVVARQDSGGAYEVATSWWQGVSAQTSYTFTDPLAALNTQRTYRLYSNTSDTLSGATNELSFTRTRVSAAVTEPPSIAIGLTDTSYTVSLTDTVAGFTYYIKDGSGTGANTGASAVATGTSTSIAVSASSCLPAASAGSSTTVYVWAKSDLNWYSTTSYYTGDSISITRSTGTGGEGDDPEVEPGDYGMIVRDASNNIIVDTTSRFGRIVGSSRSSGQLTGPNGAWVSGGTYSEWRSIEGMTNDPTTWHVIVTPEKYTNNSAYGTEFHYVEMYSDANGGRFRVLNTSTFMETGYSGLPEPATMDAKYDYIVIRTRG